MPLPPPIEVGSGKWEVGRIHKTRNALTRTHKKLRQNTKKPTPELTKKAPPLQRSKPHKLMKCEKGAWRSHVPFSHFGGAWGDWSPHKKNKP